MNRAPVSCKRAFGLADSAACLRSAGRPAEGVVSVLDLAEELAGLAECRRQDEYESRHAEQGRVFPRWKTTPTSTERNLPRFLTAHLGRVRMGGPE